MTEIDYYESERNSFTPQPPPSMVARHARWLSIPRPPGPRSIDSITPVVDYTGVRLANQVLNTIATLPKWQANVSRDQRRAVMHKAFVEPAESFTPSSGNITFIGPTSAGKTTGATHAYLCMVERCFREYTRFPAAKMIKATTIANARRNAKLGDEAEVITEAQTIGLLLLDDIGQGDDRDNSLFEVLDYRYDRGLPTIATSGLTVEQMTQRYGEHFVRRLVQTGDKRGRILSAFPRR